MSRESNIIDIQNTDLMMLDVSLLKPFPDNRDISDTEIDVLAKQIFSSGFISTITVAKEYEDTFDENKAHIPTGNYIILDGHRRVEALKYIYETCDNNYKNRKVNCLVFKDGLSYKAMYAINILGNQQKSETPKEIRERTLILAQLVKEGVITNISKSISQYSNISKRTFYAYNFINENLSDGLKECFDEGRLSMNACLRIAKRDNTFQKIVLDFCNERKGLVIQANEIEKLEHKYLEDKNEELGHIALSLQDRVTALEQKETERKINNYKAVKKARHKGRKELDDKILELITDLMRSGKVHSIYEAINIVDPGSKKELEFILQRLENDVRRFERLLNNNGTASETELKRLDVAICKLQDIGEELISRAKQIETFVKRHKKT